MSESDSMRGSALPPTWRFRSASEPAGPAVSRGADHVREQIEQVLFTTPGERVFRPEFGAGVQTLVFEPNNHAAVGGDPQAPDLAALTDALHGEVEPAALDVVGRRHGRADPGRGRRYSLATIGRDRAPAVLRRAQRIDG